MDGSYWRCLLSGVDRDCLAGQQNSEFRNGARSIQNLGSPGVDITVLFIVYHVYPVSKPVTALEDPGRQVKG